jgi:adenylate kinase
MFEEGKTARIVLSRTKEIQEVRENHPELSERIDVFEAQMRERLGWIHEQIRAMPAEDQELVSTLVIHGIHRMTDEVFL